MNNCKINNNILKLISNNKHLLILLLSILSIFLYKINILSLIISIITIILTLIFSRKHLKILIITITISLIMIIFNSLAIIHNIEEKTDVYKDKNVLLGSWLYNEYGGTYVFKEDNTYIQYSDSNTNDNYCIGTYKYTYGATADKGVVIRQDENYYYYDLTLNEEYCLIMNKKINDEYQKNMVFSIDKSNKKEIIMMNKENENIFTMTKNN